MNKLTPDKWTPKKQTFIQGTMILLAAGVINRILGFIPRIALPRIIGAEGVGIYQLGYPFFLVLVTVITGGIPLAVAKLVSEAETENKPQNSAFVLRVSLLLTVGLGILFMALAIWLAPWVTNTILTDSRVYHTFISMSPMLVIVAVSSVYRGYFQGKQNMIPSAASSIIETIARIICTLWFAYLLLPKGVAYAAAGAMLGVMAGEFFGMLALLWQFRRERPNAVKPDKTSRSEAASRGLFSRLMGINVPVTAGKLVGSFSYLFESIVTAQSLAIAGIATSVATAQYGALQGMIIPVLLLPGALTSSLAVSLVPSLSEAAARNDRTTIHKRLNQTIRLALVTGAPFSVLMYVLAEPLCRFLYNDADIAGMLRMLAPFALFVYVQAPLQAALQALDRPGRALFNTLVSATVKLLLIWYLSSQPKYGIYGAVIAIIINSIVVAFLHGYSISRLLKYRFKLFEMVKLLCSMIITAAVTSLAYRHLPFAGLSLVQFFASAFIGAAGFLITVFALKLVTPRDVKRMPVIGRWFGNDEPKNPAA
ncbi:stage V sporulation protein B [Paenibacillus sp. VCA1]|uniref:stage V sporulation protein B n=1 Tax=Paenibacillus sp. VCA1 TaxID=3039148 RepID=UPI002870F986|nr:stage V sporulation protein B [Paenibacillus sp. VCA1]MDR9853280.1 stage V sporulation protein B [Paenibacillus sp. VCA1]